MEIAAIMRRNRTSRRVQRPTCGPLSASCTGSSAWMSSLTKGPVMVGSRQPELVAGPRREMALDLGLADAGERRRPPARLVVLVDDHGTHALVEIVAFDDARHYAEFGAHARRKIPGFAAPHLRQRDLEAERRFGADRGGGLARPIIALAVERGDDVLDPVMREQAVDGGAMRRQPALARRFSEGIENGVDRHGAAEAVEQRREARRRNTMGGDAGGQRVGGIEALAGERTIGAELARHARQEPGGADIGEEADADLRHGKLEAVAGHAMPA